MKKLMLLFPAVTGIFIAGCFQPGISGDENIITDKRAVPAFSAINAVGGFDIHWSAGQPSLAIMTDSNLLSHIKSEVTDDTLHVYTDKRISPSSGITITVANDALTGARLTGGIQFNATQLSGKSLNLKATGAVDIHVDGTVD